MLHITAINMIQWHNVKASERAIYNQTETSLPTAALPTVYRSDRGLLCSLCAPEDSRLGQISILPLLFYSGLIFLFSFLNDASQWLTRPDAVVVCLFHGTEWIQSQNNWSLKSQSWQHNIWWNYSFKPTLFSIDCEQMIDWIIRYINGRLGCCMLLCTAK